MEGKILGTLGKAAGVGGIALGVLLILFQGVLQKQFLPQAGLTTDQAFAVILSLMILTFGISGIGLIAWLISRTVGPKVPLPLPAMMTIAGLIAIVLGAAVYIGAQAKSNAQSGPKVESSGGGVAIGGNVTGTTINVAAPPGSNQPAK